MVKGHRLARAISDAGLARFIRLLRYKADRFGSKLATVDR